MNAPKLTAAIAGKPGTWIPAQGPGQPDYLEAIDALATLDWRPDHWQHGEYVNLYYLGEAVPVYADVFSESGAGSGSLDVAAAMPNQGFLEPTITAQDQANADKLGPLGYVPGNTNDWTPSTLFVAQTADGPQWRFLWNGTAWAAP